ncbi:MAG: PEP-CTERM sorting domain-containing protein, partial [Pseudomonadota bacterium]
DTEAVLALAAVSGFTNFAVPCIALLACDGSVYFDTVHPTTAMHAVFADVALATVPLPGALVLFGSALAGLAWMRRRQSA